MENTNRRALRPQIRARGREQVFYRFFLPIAVVANLALGIFILAGLNPTGWVSWLEVGTGALCCLIAGWLAAAAWSKTYWGRAMANQVATWRRIAETFFVWIEDTPIDDEALLRLKSSLDEVVPEATRR